MPRWFRVVCVVAALGNTVYALLALSRGDAVAFFGNGITAGFFWWPFVSWLRHRREPEDAGPVEGAPEDLRARGRRGWVLPIVLLVVVGVLGLSRAPSILPAYALVIAALMAWMLRTGGDEVDFTADALVVRHPRGGEQRYPWQDVLELSWAPLGWPRLGAGPVARVRGSVYATPGPASPAQLATVVLVGVPARRWGRLQVRRAAALHAIPFTDDLLQLIETGKRRPRLPGEMS
ncbi:hypothetical protein [Kineococcus rhizosphaerae]|uniref:Uncharacterized protein n=1 Tax=Kineococcus rhizosphaerae TaxID=559628 RepID=A0A2T0R4N4_9ACTN|nr:hypothetical protein [Kineococcus rhizosphaerae]PRY15321.1 hypothetical protein CLV37_105249 [Kineococcus rhizosphaerae]